jgi:hypothetical protein
MPAVDAPRVSLPSIQSDIVDSDARLRGGNEFGIVTVTVTDD